jgi:hypothetical protein
MAAMTKNRNFFKWPKCSILSQKVPKFELYKHNDELFSSPDGSGELLSPLSVRRLSSVVRLSVRPLTFHILINSSEATGPI